MNQQHTPEQPAEIVARLRATFRTGRTKPVEWRTGRLRRLRAMLTENGADLAAALHEDLAATTAAIGIHSQCPGVHAGGEANLMVATRSVAASAPAEPEMAQASLMARSVMTARPGGAGER